jgi:hypothetical protein
MSSGECWRRWKALDLWVRGAVVLWAAILLAVSAYAAVKPHSPSLYFLWRHTGRTWVEGKPLYVYAENPEQAGFRYGPPYAALFVLLHWLPVSLGAVLWRLGNAAVLLAALFCWLRHAAPVRLNTPQTGLFFVIAAVLSVSNLHPGQVNLLLAALLLFAVTAVQCRRWTFAALAVALAGIMKMYPLALGLLLIAAYPRKLGWRVAVMLVLTAAVPFLFQDRHYVWRQFTDWLALLSQGDASRRFLPLMAAETYRDLLQLLRLLELPITLRAYILIQAGCGLACAVFCVAERWKGAPARVMCFHALMLGSVWMTVCGPASEPRTYGLLIPALAWWFLWTQDCGIEPARFLAVLALGGQLLAAFAPLSKLALYYFHSGGLMPLSGLTLLASYLSALPALRAAVLKNEAAGPGTGEFAVPEKVAA